MIDVCDLWERDKGEHSPYLTGRLWSHEELLGYVHKCELYSLLACIHI